jgi:hypothetical protein
MTPETELRRWLDTAADGLPDWVREELRQHYEDAVREQQANGLAPAAAHRAALRALGDADDIGGDLRELHLAERRYRIAAAASLIYPLTVLAHALLTARGGGLNIALYDLLLLLPLLYVLRTLNTLLALRFNRQVGRRIAVVMLGVTAITVPEILMEGYWLAISHGIGTELSRFGYGVLDALLLVDLAGGLVLGIGLIWLAEALLGLKSRPIRLLCLLSVIDGYGLAFTSLAQIGGLQSLLNSVWSIILIVSLITHALWMLMFYRASSAKPLAFAA